MLHARYAMSEWGWNDNEKRAEMADPQAWYLIAYDTDNNDQPVAAVHFRFDIDCDDEVLYWSVMLTISDDSGVVKVKVKVAHLI